MVLYIKAFTNCGKCMYLFLSAYFPAVNKISPIVFMTLIDFFMQSRLNSSLKRDGTNLLILFYVKVKNKIPSKLQRNYPIKNSIEAML